MNEQEFGRLTDPFRRELRALCYRMTGSADDAEDLVQETYLRAWRSFGRYEGRASIRTWLYRIATNACLNALEHSSRRMLPTGLDPASDAGDVAWLQPLPEPAAYDPADVVVARHSVRLALVAALQYLPPRHRAVLILRDVLRWRAAEVASLLDTTPAAVDNVLRRARVRLAEAAPDEAVMREPAENDALLDAYAAAFEAADIEALTRLLTDDAILEMPPRPAWFAGRARIGAFLAARVLAGPGTMRLVPVTANGQPAFASYLRGPDGDYHAHAIQVLEAGPVQRIARITIFLDISTFDRFGRPDVLPGAAAGACAGRAA